MTTNIYSLTSSLYERDYALWLEATIGQLREGQLSELDIENLIEELEGMSRSDRRAIDSLLTRLFEHLIKLAYWESDRARNSKHCIKEITNFRIKLRRLLTNSPSLKNYVSKMLAECYADARELMTRSKEMDISIIPVEPIVTIEQVLDKDWFPISIEEV